MDNIIEPNSTFDFTKLSLAHPSGIQGGAYFTKLLYDSKPLYIQTPKSLTKQGFVKSGKKITCDLMFDINNEEFITWLENLETTCHNLIFEKSESWFQNSLDLNDIETAFNSVLKSYKSGKKYLVKTNIKLNSLTGAPIIKIYNESETQLTIDDVNGETNIISILEVQGIKFSSRNFQIEIELKQTMVLNSDKIFEQCLIKKTSKENANSNVSSTINTNKVATTQEIKEVLQGENENGNGNENGNDNDNGNGNENGNGNGNGNENDNDNDNDNENDNEKVNENDNENDNEVEQAKPEIEIEIEMKNEKNLEEPITNDQIESLEEAKDFDIMPIELNFDQENLETITLKKPNEVYYKLYKEAREKAKLAKKEAVFAYLEAKNIKQTYMLEDIDSSDESDLDSDFEEG